MHRRLYCIQPSSNFFTPEDGLQELPPLRPGRPVVEHARLDDLGVHVELVLGGRQDPLLDGVDRHQAEDADLVRLPDAVGAVLGLEGRDENF